MRWMPKLGVVGAALVGAALAFADANGEGTVEATTDPMDNTMAVTVNISDLPTGKKWRDIHFYPAQGYKFPQLEGTTASVTNGQGATSPNTQSWNASRGNDGSVHVSSGSEAGFGNGGPYDFTLDFQGTGSKRLPMTWKLTNDGSATVQASAVFDDDAGQGAKGPQLSISANNGNDIETKIGAPTMISCLGDTLFGEMNYEVYFSTSLNPDYADYLHIGINSLTHPVPQGWGLQFSNASGALDEDGKPLYSPRVVTPNSPILVGTVYYAVFAVKDSGGQIEEFSRPVKITISAP